jgi:hypothetical protein
LYPHVIELHALQDFGAWFFNNANIIGPLVGCLRKRSLFRVTSGDTLPLDASLSSSTTINIAMQDLGHVESINTALRREIIMCTSWGLLICVEMQRFIVGEFIGICVNFLSILSPMSHCGRYQIDLVHTSGRY